MKNDFTAKIITFNKIYEISYKLARNITDNGFSFDIIIGIARGGVMPARLLCDYLNIDQLTSLQIRHYTSGAEELEEVNITDPIGVDIKEKNVLLADDVNDSGKTLKAAVDYIQTYEPALLKTAVLHEKKGTIYNVDFTGKKLEEWEWLIYQWAATEDVLEFLHKDNMLDQNQEKAISHLAEKYGLEVDKALFRKIKDMRENYY